MKTLISLTAIVLFFDLFIGCSKKDHIVPIDRNLIPLSANFNLNYIDQVFFTADNGLLIAGAFNRKSTIIKTNYKFEIEWTKNDYDWGNMILSTGWGSSFYGVKMVKMFQRNDGSYVCIGSVMEGGCVVYNSTLVVVLNQRGEQIHKYEFQGLGPVNALQTKDGGYLLFGNILIKLDANFKQQWQNTTNNFTYWKSQITSTSDGGFAITGTYNSDQIFLKKIDSNGNEVAALTYKHNDFPNNEGGSDLIQLQDKGFLIIGRSRNSKPLYDTDYQIIRTNLKGDTLWTKRFGDSTNEQLDRIVSQNGNEFVIEGLSFQINYLDALSTLFRINSDGQILNTSAGEKYLMIVYSPLNYYIKVRSLDTDHINFSRVESVDLFH
jgi:hypothetical protein